MVAADEQGVIHGASTMAFVNDLNFRTAVVTALGGKGVVTDELFAQYCAVAKSLGATRMQTHARPSSARLYEKIGFRNKAALMELKL